MYLRQITFVIAAFVASGLISDCLPCSAADAELGEAIAPVAATASSTQEGPKILKTLFDGSGLREAASGSGVWIHSEDAYREGGVERGTMWSSGFPNGYGETAPTVTFDLGKSREIGCFRVWNYNEINYTSIGFKEVEVSYSTDGEKFAALGTALFEQGPGEDDYEGQIISFKQAVAARYVRLHCLGNWRGGDNSGLAEIRFYRGGAGAADAIAPGQKPAARSGPEPNRPNPPRPAVAGGENIVFPLNSGVIDVTAAPYNAKGDGVADDTKAIQRALNDYPAQGAIIYLPNGTYRISKTLRWGAGQYDHQKQRLTVLQGQSRAGTVIRLKDECAGFTDPAKPKPMVWTGGAPAQRFRNQIRNCSWDTGKGNPGAIGVQFNASNVGCLRDVDIRSGDGAGVIGLDLSFADDFGPFFVKNVAVRGFDTGIATEHGVNGVTFENVCLRQQRRVGWESKGAPITVRNLVSENSVIALRCDNWWGFVTIIDAKLTGDGEAASLPAIHRLDGGLFVRNVAVSGYANAIRREDKEKPDSVPGPLVREWVNVRLPGSGEGSLGLPVKETPDTPWDELKDWAVITDYGAKMDGQSDDSEALQQAIDSGKTTVCLPRGVVVLKKPIRIRGNVRRLIGCETTLKFPVAITGADNIFTVEKSRESVLVLERFGCWFWDNKAGLNFIDNPTERTLVLRELGDVDDPVHWDRGTTITGPGELYIEDVVGRFHFQGTKVWARYLNPETNDSDGRNTTLASQWHLINDGGRLWQLGLKTEGPGPIITTRNGGRSELLGGLMYSNGGARSEQQPAFVVEDSDLSVCVTEANFEHSSYKTLIRQEKHGKVVFELKQGQTPGAPGGSMIPFWSTP